MQVLFERCGFQDDDLYRASLVLRQNASWLRGLWLPVGAVAGTAVLAFGDEPSWLPQLGLLLSVVWLLVVLGFGATCVTAHRDRLTWHTLWNSHVVHWSRVEELRVHRGHIEVSIQGQPAQTFKLIGVRPRVLLDRLKAAAAEGTIPRSVHLR